jgi:hypothetical protein
MLPLKHPSLSAFPVDNPQSFRGRQRSEGASVDEDPQPGAVFRELSERRRSEPGERDLL